MGNQIIVKLIDSTSKQNDSFEKERFAFFDLMEKRLSHTGVRNNIIIELMENYKEDKKTVAALQDIKNEIQKQEINMTLNQ